MITRTTHSALKHLTNQHVSHNTWSTVPEFQHRTHRVSYVHRNIARCARTLKQANKVCSTRWPQAYTHIRFGRALQVHRKPPEFDRDSWRATPICHLQCSQILLASTCKDSNIEISDVGHSHCCSNTVHWSSRCVMCTALVTFAQDCDCP